MVFDGRAVIVLASTSEITPVLTINSQLMRKIYKRLSCISICRARSQFVLIRKSLKANTLSATA
jgi:hypothetical protein